MNFADVNARVLDLRHAFTTQVDAAAMGEVGVRGPAGTSDEAAFLRLVAWCFGLLFEQGRITVPFLLSDSLPGAVALDAKTHKATRAMVQSLRTWLFHSLTADSEHDLEVSKRVSVWFLQTCGSTSPQTPEEWQRCFEALCKIVSDLVAYCTRTISKIAISHDDAKLILDDLRNRLRREWQPFQFDGLVENAAARLGERINARSFRDGRLSNWKKYLAAIPDGVDCVREMERLIDGEVANHFRSTLPMPIREIAERLNLDSGPMTKKAVELVRIVHESGVQERPADYRAGKHETDIGPLESEPTLF